MLGGLDPVAVVDRLDVPDEVAYREMAFTRDNVPTTALVLIDVPDVRFNVANFTQANMAVLEKQWIGVRNAMLLASRLLSTFGFTARTLTANSVIIPLAYYLYRRGAGESYLTSSSASTADRDVMRTWVLRSLVKRGIWGSGLDGLLARQRQAIRSAAIGAGWPSDALEVAMAGATGASPVRAARRRGPHDLVGVARGASHRATPPPWRAPGT